MPARQTREASEAIARRHGVEPHTLLWQQDPAAIDAGAFHTDVLAVGNQSFLMLHERAFIDPDRLIAQLHDRLGDTLITLSATDAELPVADAVKAYPFNSQILTLPTGDMAIIAPADAQQNPNSRRFVQRALDEDTPITQLHFREVRESMDNGGGPACLRLRVVLTEQERQAIAPRVFFDDTLYTQLRAWIEHHYRDRLTVTDLADPALLEECHTALDALTDILRLGPLYAFQR